MYSDRDQVGATIYKHTILVLIFAFALNFQSVAEVFEYGIHGYRHRAGSKSKLTWQNGMMWRTGTPFRASPPHTRSRG